MEIGFSFDAKRNTCSTLDFPQMPTLCLVFLFLRVPFHAIGLALAMSTVTDSPSRPFLAPLEQPLAGQLGPCAADTTCDEALLATGLKHRESFVQNLHGQPSLNQAHRRRKLALEIAAILSFIVLSVCVIPLGLCFVGRLLFSNRCRRAYANASPAITV